ncbi:MAG: hypothetical protein NTV70_01195 [Acidobacteria bacterium]|nr:hypothetical protein [Acidobacteriota bacterium]
MTLMLGMSLVFGAASAFAADEKKAEKKMEKKEGKKKGEKKDH